jgi:mevalonate kinase
MAPTAPVHVRVARLEEPVIDLCTRSTMLTGGQTHLRIGKDNAAAYFCVPPNKAFLPEHFFSDALDPLRFLKYALSFVGLLAPVAKAERYGRDAGRVLEDLRWATGGGGLAIRIDHTGPARSGFASSSAVALCLLAALYRLQGKGHALDRIYDIALLFENRLGLRSGWNDTYGVRPGLKDFFTLPTAGLPRPVERLIPIDPALLAERLWLVNTGIARMATGRMNVRHHIFLSRDETLYPHLTSSLSLH